MDYYNNGVSAVIVAAGSGSRMGGTVKKQYINLQDRPILAHTIAVFESSVVDEIILVVSPGEENYVKTAIVDHFGFQKVSAICPGGSTRFESCFAGIKATNGEIVLVHDGARPLIQKDTIAEAAAAAQDYGACVVACRAVDTIKIADTDGFVIDTPDRDNLWQVQTPQGFRRELLMSAYEEMFASGDTEGITDDAMVVERYAECRVKIVPGEPENIKITTPKDLPIAEETLRARANIEQS